MEFTLNETSGLWVVTLAGTRWSNCSVDADCPGNALCTVNAAWAQDPKTCTCVMTRVLGGDNCDECKLNPRCKEDQALTMCGTVTSYGHFEIAINSVLTVSTAIVGLLGAFTFFKLMKANLGRFDAAAASLLFACLAGLVQTILCASAASGPQSLIRPVDPATGNRGTINLALNICIPIVFLLTTIACMNVSLVWIKITDNALRMKQSASVDMVNFRRFLFGYYAILLSCMIAAIIPRAIRWVVIVGIIGIAALVLTYCVALYRLQSLIHMFSSSTNGDGNKTVSGEAKSPRRDRSSKDLDTLRDRAENGADSSPRADSKIKTGSGSSGVPDEMKQSLKSIQTLSRRLIVIGCLLIGFLSMFASTNPPTYTPDTNMALARGSLAGIWFETSLMIAFVILYVREVTVRKLKQAGLSTAKSDAVAVVAGDSGVHPVSGPESRLTSNRETA